MTISSIHFKRVDPFFCEKHNSRNTEKQPTYLLDKNLQKSNDFVKLLPEKPEVDVDITVLHNIQLKVRKDKGCRGKAPELRDSCWEAVINLEEHHTLADVKQVADFIHKEYHLTPISIAIHRDEGYVSSDGQVKYNYHAHIPFYTVSEGKSVMRTIGRKQLSDMQTEVANLLGMQRGQINSTAKRLEQSEYRRLARAEQEHNQEIESAKLAVLEKVQPVLLKSVEEKKQLNSTAKRLQNKVLTLKAQKAIVEAERKRWKEAHDFVADEYRKLQALNKTLYTKEQLNAELQKLRDEHARRLKAVKATQKAKLKIQKARLKNALDDNTVLKNKNTELQEKLETKPKEIIQKVVVKRELTEIEIENLPRVKDLKDQNTKLTQQRDNLIRLNSTVLQVIKAMYSDFDLEHPIQSLKKIYIDWKTQQQKSSITALKRSQNNESIRERVDVQQNSQSQSMSIFERKSEVKEYELIINGTEYVMTAKEMKEAIADDTFSQKQIESALTAEQRAEVFGEPQQKQSLFSRVKHSLER